jgi:hypothetical protein
MRGDLHHSGEILSFQNMEMRSRQYLSSEGLLLRGPEYRHTQDKHPPHFYLHLSPMHDSASRSATFISIA